MNNAEKQDYRVLVVECPDYEAKKIRACIDRGMDALGFKPRGQVALKPNVVFAYKPEIFSPAAYTNLEIVEGAIRAVSDRPGVSRIAVTETSAVGNPTRFSFRWAGYTERIRKIRPEVRKPLNLVAMDEDRRQPVFVGGKVHHRVRLSRTFARADTRIYLPKLKCHCVSNMTGAVKLNIGILNFDDRSIRHDFLLDEKIADLLRVGWPDFVVMDAITVGVGNEALPIPRHLGLILMGKNALAVDLVACRLLGIRGESEVPYLAVVIGRGYRPARLEDVTLLGDASGISDLDRYAERVKPYDDEFHRWQDINKEFQRLKSPLRLYHGPYSDAGKDRCETGCIMGLKMFLAFLESYAGAEAFARAKPAVFIFGRIKEPVDARGGPVFFIGTCSRAEIKNPGKVTRIDNCFVTASDIFLLVGHQTGIRSPFFDPRFLRSYVPNLLAGAVKKVFNLRYAEDFGDFIKQQLFRKI